MEVIRGFKASKTVPALHPDLAVEPFNAVANVRADRTAPDEKASHSFESDDNEPRHPAPP